MGSAISIITVSSLYFIVKNRGNKSNSDRQQTQDAENSDVSVTTSSLVSEDDTVPKPSGEDVIRIFFTLINEGNPADAVLMMSENMVGSEPIQANSLMQSYAVTFSNWNSVEVASIEPYAVNEWTSEKQFYKVIVNIDIDETAQEEMLWDQGENTRWITLVWKNGKWEIDDISTGP